MSKDRKNIVLIGGGGHCKSCIEVIESTNAYKILGILDLPTEFGKKVSGYEVIGNDNDYLKYKEKGYCFLVTAGQIKSARIRKRIFTSLKDIDAEIETIIASTAWVSKDAKIGMGTIIMHQAFVNTGVYIGENCIINTKAIIEHDSIIKDNVHISTNVVINGDCKVGNDSFIGSSSCVVNAVEINNNVVVGAGSTVHKNLSDEGTYVGNPIVKISNE